MNPRHDLFDWLRDTSRASAEVVVPLLIAAVAPSSVLDVGCGDGAWLQVFEEHGIADVLGVDSADPSRVGLPVERYRRIDLARSFDPLRRFDLAICLEVGEHLSSDRAQRLVTTLVRAAPVVAFSAAIPGQGGIGHVNEQWPDWWRDLFRAHEYHQHDIVRSALWNDERVAFWYAQNLFVYAEPEWEPLVRAGAPVPERVVHPGQLARARQPPGLRAQSRELFGSAVRAVRRRLF